MQRLLFKSEDLPFAKDLSVSRPIHYLGSKLRFVDLIVDVLDKVDPSGGPICDLFAGSGTVSGVLSKSRDVIAVDIQEYSRVLCSALLQPASFDEIFIDQFMLMVSSTFQSGKLDWAVGPLVEHEDKCLSLAASGDLEPLCDLLENGSIIKYEQNKCPTKDTNLLSALKETFARLGKMGFFETPAALATRYFGGIYFSYSQASQIDTILESVNTLPSDQKDTFLAAILSAVSEVVNTVGKQFAQPIRPRSSGGKPKPNLFTQVHRDRSVSVIKVYEKWLRCYQSIQRTKRPHKIFRKDYKDALKSFEKEVSVIYADPPYTRDHYSRFYHVLETLCLRDNPVLSTVRINGEDHLSRGIYRVERHQSPFCIITKAPKAFYDLFSEVRRLEVPLVLSYSPYRTDVKARPRLMTLQAIDKLARKFFKRVEILPVGNIAHNKLNNSKNNTGVTYDAEVLIICET